MNLEKMKEQRAPGKHRKWGSNVKRGIFAVTTFLCMATPFLSAQSIYAAESTNPAIAIEKPDGWKQGDTSVSITVDASQMGEGFKVAKIEAKAGKDGSWQDRSIRCYDTEKPTLSASLTDGVLTIQGNDAVSGISAATVNGTTYTDLSDGKLKVQLTQKDFTTKQIEITVTDGAGNTSDKYTLQNPYYEWAVRQAQQQSTANSDMSTTGSAATTEETATSPLPQDAQASEPTEARGTVDERTVTGIEEELAATGEDAENIAQTATEGTKEFYTISTKSGKVFYLVIDNSKSQDNVYFLTEVSEKDLMNFTLSDTVTLPEVDTVYAEPETEEPEPTQEPEEEEPETEEVQMPEGSYLLIGLAAAGALGAGYYFKVYKPKHEYDDEDEYEDNETEEAEEPAEPDDAEEETLPDEEDPEEVLEDDEES